MPTELITPFDANKQLAAECDTLGNLWTRLLPSPAPSNDEFHHWLIKLSFFEVGRVIHKTQRLNTKYKGDLKPRQLLTYFQQQAALSLKDKTEKING
jgi:hypothetical protein